VSRRLVVDANRVFSALLTNGETRRAMMTTGAALLAPRFLRLEIEKHKTEIACRARGGAEDVERALAILYRRIAWVADEELATHLAKAHTVLAAVDAKDVPYLACALAVEADAIWSHDLDFDKQSLDPRIPHPDAAPEPK
jgi:predicted nucleic acid-binding protein